MLVNRRKLYKLVNFPEQFVRDMKSPALRGLLGPTIVKAGSQLNRLYGDGQHLPAARSTEDPMARIRGIRASEASVESYTEHLFSDRARPFRKGVATLPWRVADKNTFLPELLDFACLIAPMTTLDQARDVDVFFTFGVTEHQTQNLAREAARMFGKPLLSLEYGFVSSADIALAGSRQHSVVISGASMYYDSTQPSLMENRLNDEAFSLDPAKEQRAKNCITRITQGRITKYNHAPEIDLAGRLGTPERPKILLVDQRYGDASVRCGLADESTFAAMLAEARATEGHDIVVKLHPDAIGAGAGSYIARLLDTGQASDVTFIDYDVNPFSLFDAVDKVFTATSQIGFEALMAGKEVHCFAAPFYAGWGLTVDHCDVPRRLRKRSIAEVFHVFYLEFSRYYTPATGLCELECLVDYLALLREHRPSALDGGCSKAIEVLTPGKRAAIPMAPAKFRREALRVLFIIPSARLGATGRYFQHLAWYLQHHGVRVLVLCDGGSRPQDNGVRWLSMKFDGMRLSSETRKAIADFDPHVVYENGVRSRAQRAALEALLLSSQARLAMQSEDDDVQVYGARHPNPDLESLTLLDKPRVRVEELANFIVQNDWPHTLRVLNDPRHDRWVEPVLRSICYHTAGLHTAIWYPFEERLRHEYGAPTLVVPPVIPLHQFDASPISDSARAAILRKQDIDPTSLVFYLAGTVYDYSDEFEVFLDALNLLGERTERKLTLLFVSGRTNLALGAIAKQRLVPEIQSVDLGSPSDQLYLDALRASDVICAPGLPDAFNRYRLPSRLVKAMALGKAILTFRIGFGESLVHGHNAFLTEGADARGWAHVMEACLDPQRVRAVGQNGRRFAEKHFDAEPVALRLIEAFRELLKQPPAFCRAQACESRNPASVPVAEEKVGHGV